MSDMPGLTALGLPSFDPKNSAAIDGMYNIMQTLGSFPLAYVKDGVLTQNKKGEGDSWDFRPEEKNNKVTLSFQGLRALAGKHGTNEADNIPAIVTTKAKIPYKKRNKK